MTSDTSVTSGQPTVFHITHYKAGSQWVYAVLQAIAAERIVTPRPQNVHLMGKTLKHGAIYPTVYLAYEQFAKLDIPGEHHRFVVLRDLRDTLVSYYFSLRYSHAETDEFVRAARNELIGMNQQDGMRWLLENRYRLISATHKTWIGRCELLIKYEDLLDDEYGCFERIVDHCEIDVAKSRLRKAVESVSFERLTGRRRGQEDKYAHQRKGIAGDWHNYFDDGLKARFKELYGDLVIAAGYEHDDDW